MSIQGDLNEIDLILRLNEQGHKQIREILKRIQSNLGTENNDR